MTTSTLERPLTHVPARTMESGVYSLRVLPTPAFPDQAGPIPVRASLTFLVDEFPPHLDILPPHETTLDELRDIAGEVSEFVAPTTILLDKRKSVVGKREYWTVGFDDGLREMHQEVVERLGSRALECIGPAAHQFEPIISIPSGRDIDPVRRVASFAIVRFVTDSVREVADEITF